MFMMSTRIHRYIHKLISNYIFDAERAHEIYSAYTPTRNRTPFPLPFALENGFHWLISIEINKSFSQIVNVHVAISHNFACVFETMRNDWNERNTGQNSNKMCHMITGRWRWMYVKFIFGNKIKCRNFLEGVQATCVCTQKRIAETYRQQIVLPRLTMEKRNEKTTTTTSFEPDQLYPYEQRAQKKAGSNNNKKTCCIAFFFGFFNSWKHYKII